MCVCVAHIIEMMYEKECSKRGLEEEVDRAACLGKSHKGVTVISAFPALSALILTTVLIWSARY